MDLGFLTRFFCFCSGASLTVLKECPIEINKYVGIGATVFFTGLLAAISGSYALYSVFNTTEGAGFLALFFGIFWGLLIFNLDRYIVSSLKKSGKKWKEVLTALPRIIVAIVISMVIAKPLEVRIFKERVDRQIHENMLHKLVDDKLKINEIYQQDKLNKALVTKNNELTHIEKELNGLPQGEGFQKVYNEMKKAESEFEKTASFNEMRIKQLQKQIANIYKTQPNRLFDARGRLIAESVSPEAYRKIKARNNEAYILSKKTKEVEKKYKNIKEKVSKLIEQHRAQVQDRLNQAKNELGAINKEKAVADSLAFSQFAKGDQVNRRTYQANLITQLEALGTLTEKRFSSMWWASLFISLLFILVETSPIMVKLIAQKGPYELILERHEYEIMLYNQKKISLIKSQINQKHFLELLEQEEKSNTKTEKTLSKLPPLPIQKDEDNSPKNHKKVYAENSSPSNIESTTIVKPIIPPIARKDLNEITLEGITWKRTEAKDALCYVFRKGKKGTSSEFLLIANGDVSYGKWDYIEKNKIWIELWGEKFIYEICGLNSHYLQLRKQYEHTNMTFKRM